MKSGYKKLLAFLVILVVVGAVGVWIVSHFSETPTSEAPTSEIPASETSSSETPNSNESIISEDVIIYTEESEWEIIEVTEDTVIISEEDEFEVGSIISSGVTDKTPDGLLRRVTKVEEVPDGYQLTTRPAALTEAIEQCEIRIEADLMEDGTYDITKFEEGGVEKEDNTTSMINTLFNVQEVEAAEISFPIVDETFGSVKVKAAIKMSLEMVIDNGDILFSFSIGPQIGTSLEKEGFSYDDYDQTVRWFENGHNQTILVSGIFPVVIYHNIIGSIDVNTKIGTGNHNLDISTFDMQLGFYYSSDEGLKPIQKNDSKPLKVDSDIVEFSGTLYPNLTYEMLLYGSMGPSITTGLKTEGTLRDVEVVVSGTEQSFAFSGVHLIAKSFDTKGSINLRGDFVFRVPRFFNIFDNKDVDFSKTIFDNELITLWEENWSSEIPPMIAIDDFHGIWKDVEGNEWGIEITPNDDVLIAAPISLSTGAHDVGGYVFAMPYVLNFQIFPSDQKEPIQISGYELIAGQGQEDMSPPSKFVMSEDKQSFKVYTYDTGNDLSNLVISDLEAFMSDENILSIQEYVKVGESEIGTDAGQQFVDFPINTESWFTIDENLEEDHLMVLDNKIVLNNEEYYCEPGYSSEVVTSALGSSQTDYFGTAITLEGKRATWRLHNSGVGSELEFNGVFYNPW